MKTVRILVADDHEVVRKGVCSLLETHPGWTVIGEAITGRDAVKKAAKLKPDVVILDYSMPELNGLEAIRQILKAAPQTEVLVLTMYDSEPGTLTDNILDQESILLLHQVSKTNGASQLI